MAEDKTAVKFTATARILDLGVKEIGEEGVIDLKIRLTPMKPEQLVDLAKMKVAHDVTLKLTFNGKYAQKELFTAQAEELGLPPEGGSN